MIHHFPFGAVSSCELTDGAGQCSELRSSAFGELDVLLIDGGADPTPTFQVGKRGQWKLVNQLGVPRVSLPNDGVSATTVDGGGVAVLSLTETAVPATDMYQVAVDGTASQRFVATTRPLLYDGFVIAQRGDRVLVTPIGADESVDIGGLRSPLPTSQRACRAADIVAVRFTGEARSSDAMAILQRGAWTVTDLPLNVPPVAVSCHAATAHLTWIETIETTAIGEHVRGTHRIVDVACDAAGCRQDSADVVLHRYDAISRLFVASLGDNVLVLWRSSVGDVRARVGPLHELAARPSLPVLEDEAHGGPAWDRATLRLLPAGDRAVLLVEEGGTYGVAIAEDGARPLWQGTPPP